MTKTRWAAAIGLGGPLDRHARETLMEHARADPSLLVSLDLPHLLILTNKPALRVGQTGVILGEIYGVGLSAPVAALAGCVQASVTSSRGRHLADAFWGNYVFLQAADNGEVDVLRAPFGTLQCIHAVIDGAVWLASDLKLLPGALKLVASRTALGRFLLAEDIVRRESCLEGICTLRGGHRLAVANGRTSEDAIWSPWPFANVGEIDPVEGQTRLRQAVVLAASAMSATHGKLLLRLSGGLDSSIVACALSATHRDFEAMTLFGADPAGDERDYARAVADHLAITLTERPRDTAHVQMFGHRSSSLRPFGRSFSQASRTISQATAEDVGAGAVIDGGGGDQVFCGLVSPRLAADCLLSNEGRSKFWSTSGGLARLAETSLLTVARRAWIMSRRRSWPYPYPVDLRYLPTGPEIEEWRVLEHPWLSPEAPALPGKIAHVACIVAAEALLEALDQSEGPPLLSPLLTQPVIEAALRIPSWNWVGPGLDRYAARLAFRNLLPSQVAHRRSKGSPDAFIIGLFESNRPTLRSMLLDGHLSEMGLIDRTIVREAIDDLRPATGVDFYRLMRLVDVEAWVRGY